MVVWTAPRFTLPSLSSSCSSSYTPAEGRAESSMGGERILPGCVNDDNNNNAIAMMNFKPKKGQINHHNEWFKKCFCHLAVLKKIKKEARSRNKSVMKNPS